MSVPIDHIQDGEQVKTDVRTIVGGDFTPDCLGPEKYERIKNSARNRAEDYLTVFDHMYLSERYDAAQVSELYLPSFLELVKDRAPEHTRRSAEALRTRYDAALISHDAAVDRDRFMKLLADEPQRLLQRVRTKRIELDALLASLPK